MYRIKYRYFRENLLEKQNTKNAKWIQEIKRVYNYKWNYAIDENYFEKKNISKYTYVGSCKNRSKKQKPKRNVVLLFGKTEEIEINL